MRTYEIKKKVNLMMAIAFGLLAASGAAHDLLPQPVFSFLHGAAAIGMMGVTLIHLLLNRRWIQAAFLNGKAASKSSPEETV